MITTLTIPFPRVSLTTRVSGHTDLRCLAMCDKAELDAFVKITQLHLCSGKIYMRYTLYRVGNFAES